MSLRVQIFCVVFSMSILVVAVGSGLGFLVMRGSVNRLEQDSLRVAAELADGLVSNKLDYLKLGLRAIAQHIEHFSESDDIKDVIDSYGDINLGSVTNFLAIAVVDRIVEEGKEKFAVSGLKGRDTIPENLLAKKPEYIVRAFNGIAAISTTVKFDDDTGNPRLRIYGCVPVGEMYIDDNGNKKVKRILCGTLEGTYFADLLDNFHFWNDKGDIVISDKEGNILATKFRNIVLERHNYINLAKSHPNNPDFQTLAKFFTLSIDSTKPDGKPGMNVHVLNGHKRIAFYQPITGSTMGWSISTTAPVLSSPYREAVWWITAPALACLTLGFFIAYFASGHLVITYEEAIESKQAAEKASISKSNFLANMSHEMRTPLNAIIGLSELAIGSDDAKGEVAETLDKIYGSGTTLLNIINDLLDISKIESGKLELVPVEYDLPSVINDTAVLNSVRIGSRPIQFTIDVDESLPSRFLGDELRIKQMLSNLLSNAFKYTQEGDVKLSIMGKREGADFFIIFKVSDTGIGIRKEDMALLFQEYRQLDSRANRKIEGAGLGLSLVRKMAEIMGGTVSVESKYKEGSTFTLQILQTPLTDEPIGKEVAYNLSHMQFTYSKLAKNSRLVRVKLPYARVLVVDDVMTNIDVARGMLKPYQMRVDSARSGQEAINAILDEKVRYNAVFMDHMMPGMDGIEATKRIREIGTEYAKNVPIIALTANAIVGNEEMFLQNGFQAFLSKPIDIMRLDVVVRRWVRDRSVEATLNLGQDSSPSAAHLEERVEWEIEGVNKTKALEQFGSEDTYIIILKSFVTNTPGLLDKIRTCSESQLEDYRVFVHGIKGTCFSICADVVGKQAEALEHAAKHGDIQYVSEHNTALIEATEALIECIKEAMQKIDH